MLGHVMFPNPCIFVSNQSYVEILWFQKLPKLEETQAKRKDGAGDLRTASV